MQEKCLHQLLAAILLCVSLTSGITTNLTSDDPTTELAATDTLLELSLYDLLNLTVTTTSKTEEKLSEAAGVISVMTRDDLNRFGARTLEDILMRMPSINLSTIYLTDRSCISMRGD